MLTILLVAAANAADSGGGGWKRVGSVTTMATTKIRLSPGHNAPGGLVVLVELIRF